MKETRKGLSRLIAVLLVVALCLGILPAGILAVDTSTGNSEERYPLKLTDVTDSLTLAERLAFFEENMDPDVVSRSETPANDEIVKVIVTLETESLIDLRDQTDKNLTMLEFQQSKAAIAQLEKIAAMQNSVKETMQSKGIEGKYTFSYAALLAGFSAEVPYGTLDEIRQIDGVSSVVMCDVYYPAVMGEATLGSALSGAEIADFANDTPYQGAGMLVGIIDTGLDWQHEAFANAPMLQKLRKSALEKLLYKVESYEENGVTKYNVSAYSYAALWYAQKNSKTEPVLLTADDLYKSAKVPFAFDYADVDTDVIPTQDAVEKYGNDHGTHVAGIAAGKTVDGDGNVIFKGQAPEAQLAIFKVFSDKSSGASTDTILAALNDALLLGVDVINMSLGSGGGFAAEQAGTLVAKYYDTVKAAGILLNCSAGNAYSSSRGGKAGDFASTSDPDTGIISSASSYPAALSVASVNASETKTFRVGTNHVAYTDAANQDFYKLLLGTDSERKIEYVMIPDAGNASDYEGIDVTGKIAVVKRGGLSFELKQINAAEAGAVGCIVYNNVDGYPINMAITDYRIPSAFVSRSAGAMMAEQQDKSVVLSVNEAGIVSMSDFSSWGPLPSLELKPEITAPGGDIYSTLPFGQYGLMSGTSMASPYMAGTAAACLQYVNKLYPTMTAVEKQLLVNRLLMSTANILYDEYGVAYSPRKQGAGMSSLADAVATPAYLYVRGIDKTKIELGDDAQKTGVYTLRFVVKNLTGAALRYEINTTVQTETTGDDALYIVQAGHTLSPESETIRVSGGQLDGKTVTVPANGETGITVTVKLSDADRAYLEQFPNGIYVEGFVELTAQDNPSLSIPFLGFYGDWGKAPILEDADIYNGKDVKMFATAPSGIYAMMYIFRLGTYPFVIPEGYDAPAVSADHISLDLGGGNGISNLYYLQAGMLRGAKNADVVIRDEDTGEIYAQWNELNVRKAMYNASTGQVRAGLVGEIWPPLSGGSSVGLIPNNTHMVYDATLYVDGYDSSDNVNNRYSFRFTSDCEMPYIVDRENLALYRGEDGRMYVNVVIADNFALAGATLYSAEWKVNVSSGKKEIKPGSNYYGGIIPAVKDDGTSPGAYEPYTYTFDVTDYYKSFTEGCFYVLAYDYAMNETAYRVTLPKKSVTRITLNETEKTLPINGYFQLDATVEPDDATNQILEWTSSNEDIVVVRDGLVSAKATGTATVTVSSVSDPEVTAACDITVTTEVGPAVPMSEFRLNYLKVSMIVGEVNTNTRLYAYNPFNATDLELEWSSADESIVTVEPNGTEPYVTQYAKLTAVGPGETIVTARAKNNPDAYAELTVVVTKGAEGGTFDIDGDVLRKYSGTDADVVIPDGIRVIADSAFTGNKYVQNVICPDSLKEIGVKAFFNCTNLKTVRLPETMDVIGESAFQNCKLLTSFGLDEKGVIPKGLTVINYRAFYACNALEGDLVIPDGVTTIMGDAFYGCKKLTSITMADSVTTLDAATGGQFNGCDGVLRIALSAGLTELPKQCFMNARSLIELPDLKNVTSIGRSCFQHMDSAISITIPASVTYLGDNAFAYADVLESVTVLGNPEFGKSTFSYDLALTSFNAPNVTTIGEELLKNCTALKTFTVPDRVSFIGKNAFGNCSALESIIFPATYSAETLSFGLTPLYNCKAFKGFVVEEGANVKTDETGALYTADGKVLALLAPSFSGTSFAVPEGVETIGSGVFYNMTKLTSVTFPSTLKNIGDYAFYKCALTKAELPDSIETIGNNAFDTCASLTSVTFGANLISIGEYAFNKCAKLTAAEFGPALKTIGARAFSNCTKIAKFSVQEGLESIGNDAFYSCGEIVKILLPSTLTTLGKEAFYGCKKVTEINCGGVTVIPQRAFYNCGKLVKLTMSDDVTEIGPSAFASCNLLADITWPSQLVTIGDTAFNYCRALKNLDLSGTKVETIGKSAFAQCYEARVLILPETIKTVGATAFNYLNYNKTGYVTEVNIPASLTFISKDAFNHANRLQNITVSEGNQVYTASNGVLFLKTGEIHIWPAANSTDVFTVPADVTSLPEKMFYNNKSIKTVYIHGNVTSIGANAFYGSNIERIVFEPSANGLVIGNYAFYGCSQLKTIELPYGTTEIGSQAFQRSALESIVLPDTVTKVGTTALAYMPNLKYVKLSAAMTEIPDRCFIEDTALEEITLPASIRKCGMTNNLNAYDGCTSLKNIFVEEGSRYFKSVDGVLYDANGATLRYYPEGKDDEKFTVPEGTIRIGARAFFGNEKLKAVVLPSTLVRIGTHAFASCTELKDFYFFGMTAPMLESTMSSTGPFANLTLYCNFIGIWATYIVNVGYEYQDYGINLYYLEGATGYDAYVWDKYFNTENGSVNVMTAGYFTPSDLTAVDDDAHNVQLDWNAVKQAAIEGITYTVERSVAVKVAGEQNTWDYEGFEIIAEGLTDCSFLDRSGLSFGLSYAYRVTAYNAEGETGPAAIVALTIDEVTNDDEAAVLELIAKIEALKPTSELNHNDLEKTLALQAEYDALTDAQKALVVNYATLVCAEAQCVTDAIYTYDPATVKSSDEADIGILLGHAAKLLADTALDDDCKSALEAAKTFADGLLARIAEVRSKMSEFGETISGYALATVKSSDKTALETLLAKINALLVSENLTEAERETVESNRDSVQALLDRIAEVQRAYEGIRSDVDSYTLDTVKSSDEANLRQLIARINELLATENLTDAEREQLLADKALANALLDRIEVIGSSIDGLYERIMSYQVATIRSYNRSDVEKLLDEVALLLAGQNLTAAERQKLDEAKAHAETLLARLAEVAQTLTDAIRISEQYAVESVKTSDYETLLAVYTKTVALLRSDNLTESERTALVVAYNKLNDLLSQIDSIEGSLEALEALIGRYTLRTVTSADEEDITLGGLLTAALLDSDNLTEQERILVEGYAKKIDELLARIHMVAEEIDRVRGAYAELETGKLTGDDRTTVTDLIRAIDVLLDSQNLTDAEREELVLIRAKLNAMLEALEAKELIGKTYQDVSGHWAYDEIVEAIYRGLFNGVSETEFAPNEKVTRGMFVTVLWRAAGCPESTGELKFADVGEGAYYAEAVRWACEKGITNGVSATEFKPGMKITREQMATFLYRFVKAYDLNLPKVAEYTGYADAGKVSSYAAEAMQWAVEVGLLKGYEDGMLRPDALATRAEAAVIMIRFLDNAN